MIYLSCTHTTNINSNNTHTVISLIRSTEGRVRAELTLPYSDRETVLKDP